jgi:predicted NBD/HSP70 family sugar kinase
LLAQPPGRHGASVFVRGARTIELGRCSSLYFGVQKNVATVRWMSQRLICSNEKIVQRKQYVAPQRGLMGEKADSELVRRQNRKLVLEALRRNGQLGRVDLGRHTGLSPASITSITAQLIADGAVEELLTPMGGRVTTSTNSGNRRGRPIVQLSLKSSATHVIAIRISIDEVDIAVADFCGTIVGRRQVKVKMQKMTGNDLADVLIDALPSVVKACGLSMNDINRIGIAVQGVANTRDGSIAWSPIFHARDLAVTEPLERVFGVPCMIANDTNMMAEGLTMGDRSQFGGVSIIVFVGYGVGMAILIDGKIYQGATGAAAEFGHMNHLPHGALCRCGRRGCLEAYVADYAIQRFCLGGAEDILPTADSVPDEQLDALVELANQGDKTALGAFNRAGEAMGYGLARAIALLNPDRIVIGGPVILAARHMETGLQSGLHDGLVDALSTHATIDYISFDTSMIIRGTVSSILAEVDTRVFALGPLPAQHLELEAAS